VERVDYGESMAREVAIGAQFSPAKMRNPWGVFGLSFITFGIYAIFWWYYINREMADLGRVEGQNLGTSPGTSCAAWIFGSFALGIPTVWTIVTTTQRIQASQRTVGVNNITSGWLAAAVWILTLGLGGGIFTQYAMNKVWELRPDYVYQPGQPQVSGPPSPPAAPSPPSAGGLADTDSDLGRVAKLAELRDSGAISEDEFEAEKSKIRPPSD
jgi:hypothetical protein